MEKNLQPNSIPSDNPIPFFSVTHSLMSLIEDSLRNGEKIEFVSFNQWQKKHKLNIKANKKEFRPLDHFDGK